jgi:hypothetical protein
MRKSVHSPLPKDSDFGEPMLENQSLGKEAIEARREGMNACFAFEEAYFASSRRN